MGKRAGKEVPGSSYIPAGGIVAPVRPIQRHAHELGERDAALLRDAAAYLGFGGQLDIIPKHRNPQQLKQALPGMVYRADSLEKRIAVTHALGRIQGR